MLRNVVWAEKEIDEPFLDHFKQANIRRERNNVTRKIINSAIYVEKPLSAVSSESGFLSKRTSNDELFEVKVKRCTCSTTPKTCSFHCNQNLSAYIATEERGNLLPAISCTKIPENKTKVSQRPGNFNLNSADAVKKHVMKQWIAKKEEEKKKKEMDVKTILETKIKDKEMVLDQERKNFTKWLTNKKKIEIDAKKNKEKELEEQQLKELDKEKRQLENQLNFQLWLRRKEEGLLEKKIKQQLLVIDDLEHKQKHVRDNEQAFTEWVKNSKNKQKPAPLNKGLESLYSSTSVTYVNPTPWNSIT